MNPLGPHTVFLGLGANLGDRAAAFDRAISLLPALGVEVLVRSPRYETAPWGNTDQPPFYNQVVAVQTQLSPWELLEGLQSIEAQMGRTKHIHWGPRSIDIDILAYGQQQVQGQRLNIPHPFLGQRAFVLLPWADIAPDFMPPGHASTIAQLAARLPTDEIRGVVRIDPASPGAS